MHTWHYIDNPAGVTATAACPMPTYTGTAVAFCPPIDRTDELLAAIKNLSLEMASVKADLAKLTKKPAK